MNLPALTDEHVMLTTDSPSLAISSGNGCPLTVADETTILYGGSCKPSNAEELFANPDVDGGLIGGASLKAEDFIQIVNAY